MQECEGSFLLRDENCRYHGEINLAMELCKKVQVEEYVIHAVGSTNFYTHLQFSLLASTWFPRPLGVGLWSALHMLLVLYETLMLLVLFPTIFVLAVLIDAFIVCFLIYLLFAVPIMLIVYCLGFAFGIALAVALGWLWVVITCQCCTMPGRAPGQGLGHYILTAGGTIGPRPQDPEPEPVPVVEGGGAAADGPFSFLNVRCRDSFTVKFVNQVIRVSFPYRRAQLRDLSREIVPWCDSIVI